MKGFEKAIKHPLFKYAMYTLAVINLYGYITKKKFNCILSFVAAVMVTHYFIRKNIPLALLVGLFISTFVLGCGKILEGNVTRCDGLSCPHRRGGQPGGRVGATGHSAYIEKSVGRCAKPITSTTDCKAAMISLGFQQHWSRPQDTSVRSHRLDAHPTNIAGNQSGCHAGKYNFQFNTNNGRDCGWEESEATYGTAHSNFQRANQDINSFGVNERGSCLCRKPKYELKTFGTCWKPITDPNECRQADRDVGGRKPNNKGTNATLNQSRKDEPPGCIRNCWYSSGTPNCGKGWGGRLDLNNTGVPGLENKKSGRLSDGVKGSFWKHDQKTDPDGKCSNKLQCLCEVPTGKDLEKMMIHDCREAAATSGYKGLWGVGNYGTKGCYTYKHGYWKNKVYFGKSPGTPAGWEAKAYTRHPTLAHYKKRVVHKYNDKKYKT